MSCDWIFIIKHVKHISRETLEKSKLLRNYAFLAFSSIIMSYLVPISNFKRKCVLYSYTLVEILTRYLFLQTRFYHQGILFWNQSFNECWFDNAYSTSKAISKWNKKKNKLTFLKILKKKYTPSSILYLLNKFIWFSKTGIFSSTWYILFF